MTDTTLTIDQLDGNTGAHRCAVRVLDENGREALFLVGVNLNAARRPVVTVDFVGTNKNTRKTVTGYFRERD